MVSGVEKRNEGVDLFQMEEPFSGDETEAWKRPLEASLRRAYQSHAQGALVRSGISVVMWFFLLVVYRLDIIRLEHFTGVSISILYLILFNVPVLWILRNLRSKRLFGFSRS